MTEPGVTAQPAAEQAKPTTTVAPAEIGVHQLALTELAIQVYAIAHDVDRDLVTATDEGVPEILALLEAYERGLEDAIMADLATVLASVTTSATGVPARRSPNGWVAQQITWPNTGGTSWLMVHMGGTGPSAGLTTTYLTDADVAGWPVLAEVATAARTES